MSKLTSILVVFLVTFSLCYKAINDREKFVDYDIDEANQVWDRFESHVYVKRTTPTTNSIVIADNIVNNNQMFLMRFWDNFQFDDTSELEFGLPVRSYNSFIQASEEAAISRLYGGIHYEMAITNGVSQGEKIGEFITNKLTTLKK